MTVREAGPPIFNTNTGKHIYYAEDNYLALPPKYLWGRPNLTTVPPFAHHRLQFAITGSLDNINNSTLFLQTLLCFLETIFNNYLFI